MLICSCMAFIAFEHLYFALLEIFLWKRPIGRRVFRQSEEQAEMTARLAMNQGVYNLCLAIGLIVSILIFDSPGGQILSIFCLAFVAVVGSFGALSVSRSIFWIQAFPAFLVLSYMLLGVGR